MAYDIELAKSVYEELEEIADALDMPVASLLDDIVRRWLKKNRKRIMEDEPDSEDSEIEEDEPED